MKRFVSLLLTLSCAVLLLCAGLTAASASQWMPGNGKPYYIMVNRAQSTVTVYGLDERGYYTDPVKAMVCSTGRKGHATPTGTFAIGGRWTWVHMLDNSYGQYCTQIQGNILFHSVCYNKKDPSTLITSEYNGLGAPASLGCVRLQTADAKWIYDNCGRGTKVTVYDDASSPGPLGKPEKLVDHISEKQANGWDPTDPREANPWHKLLTDSAPAETPAPVETPAPAETPVPSEAPAPSETPVPAETPVPVETPVPSETPVPAEPSAPAPQPDPAAEAVSYADVAESLYKLSGGTSCTHSSQFTTWAVERRLLDGMLESGFDPDAPISRQDMVLMLYRYETQVLQRAPRRQSSLVAYDDWREVRFNAREAVRWALGSGLVQPAQGRSFQPAAWATRTQLDAAMERYEQLL